jgi:hypothetical protein
VFTWDNVKSPADVKRYAFTWASELGASEVITGASAVLIDGFGAGLTITGDDQFDATAKLSFFKVSGGVPGRARIQGTVTINSGDESFTQVGEMVIAEPSDPASSSLRDLRADLISLRQARITALTGTQVKEVWRDGRRLVYNVASVNEISKAIHEYEDLIADAEASAAGTNRGRYRALGVRFS